MQQGKMINSFNSTSRIERSPKTDIADVVVSSGLSIHIFGNSIGVYCDRLEASRGFAELPVKDLKALISFFSSDSGQALLRDADSV